MTPRLLATTALLLLPLCLPASAQLFGPSDEEIAAQKAHEDGQDAAIRQNTQDLADTRAQLQAQIRDLSDRVRSLTDSLARATGANEDLSHQIGLLNAKIDQQQKDFAYRLCTISAQQLGADAGSLNCAAAGTAGPAAPAAPAQTPPGAALTPLGGPSGAVAPAPAPMRGRPPGVLGTLPAGPSQGGGFAPGDSGGGGGDSRQYDAAMNLLARAQYAEASAAFRAYADSHPDDGDLSPQALYWVGNIAFLQQDYATAARTFAEQIKKYPKAPRGADSLLKMGQALVAQGQTTSGCTAFAAIRKQYPDASASTLAAAASARKAANCR